MDGKVVGAIGKGMLVLIGLATEDTRLEAGKMV